jgi:hypothetical protein
MSFFSFLAVLGFELVLARQVLYLMDAFLRHACQCLHLQVLSWEKWWLFQAVANLCFDDDEDESMATIILVIRTVSFLSFRCLSTLRAQGLAREALCKLPVFDLRLVPLGRRHCPVTNVSETQANHTK